MRKQIRIIIAIAGIVTVFTIDSFGRQGDVEIEMTNSSTYQPAEVVVKKGDKITWKNSSGHIQTITVNSDPSDDKQVALIPKDAEPFSSGAVMPGETFTYSFFIPGTYEIVSLPNSEKGMKGKIIVED